MNQLALVLASIVIFLGFAFLFRRLLVAYLATPLLVTGAMQAAAYYVEGYLDPFFLIAQVVMTVLSLLGCVAGHVIYRYIAKSRDRALRP